MKLCVKVRYRVAVLPGLCAVLCAIVANTERNPPESQAAPSRRRLFSEGQWQWLAVSTCALLWTLTAAPASSAAWTGTLVNTATGVSYNTATYPTKADAVAAMKQLDPGDDPGGQRQALQEQQPASGMTPTTVTYSYAAPPVQPTWGTTYYYWQVLGGPNVGLEEGYADTFFTTQSSALANLDTTLGASPVGSSCPTTSPYTSFAPTGSWTPENVQNGTILLTGTEDYSLFTEDAPGCAPGTGSQPSEIGSQQFLSCPAGYTLGGSAPNYTCNNPFTGSVTGPMMECPSNGSPSPQAGDPCNVSTGDFSQTENDYSAAGLPFSRYYHSANLELHGLGVGWTHNYASALILNHVGGSPVGLLRPDGHHDAVQSISGEYVSLSGAAIHIQPSGSNWIAYLKNGSSEVYNSTGKLLQYVTAAGLVTTLAYNASSGLLSTVTGPFGHTLKFAYDSNNRLLTVTEPDGTSTITFAYDANSNLISSTYPDSSVRQYQYQNSSLPNNLTGLVDESNTQFLTVQYNSTSGAAISAALAGGVQAVSMVYDATSTVVTDSLGATNTYTFTNDPAFAPRITSLTRNTLVWSYVVPAGATDPQRRVTQSTDANGNVTTYSYDTDHLTSKVEASGTSLARTTAFQYLATTSALPTLVTEALRQTSYTYLSGTNLLQVDTLTDPATQTSRAWNYTYDSYGRVLTAKGPRTDVNSTTTYTYYTCTTGVQCGQLNTLTDALGHVQTYTSYSAHGQPLSITDPNGVITTLVYDARQRLTTRQIGSETTTLSYWSTGLVKQVTFPDSSFLLFTYDGAHRLTQISDELGNKLAYTLDAMGNRTAENTYDPSGVLHRTHSRAINVLNQVYQDVNAAGTAAVTTTYGYDNNGNQTSVAAPLSRDTGHTYDQLNRLANVTDPANGVTQFGYDLNDALTSVTDPRTLKTSYQRNGFRDVLALTSPDTGTTTNSYDSAGNLATSTDARGTVATYSYDALNRAVTIAYSDAGVADQTITLTYDAGTNGKGHLTGASDANHTLTWAYDGPGRVITKTQTVGTVILTTGYGYTNGDLTTISTPSGQTITYGYNSNHQITSVTLNGTTVILNSVTYEPFGSVNGWTWGNGTAAIRTFDTDGYISQIASAGTKTYAFDAASRITGITDATNSALSWTFGYDALDRANSAATTTQTQGFTYDANGNRLTETGTSAATFNIATSSNRLSSTTGSLTRTYSYDSAGHTLSYATLSLSYDDAGRLVSALNGSTSTIYKYDALGERLLKSTGGTTTYFAYDLSGHLLGEYTGTGALIQEIVWMGDTPVASVRPTACGLGSFYIHTDHLNTPRRITRRTTADIVWRWDSDPFGDTAPNQNPSGLGTFAFNLRFPGQYYDVETGLNQNTMRDYDALVGRYVESDPIGLKGGLNTYAYALQNPVWYFDANGREITCGGNFCGTNTPAYVPPVTPPTAWYLSVEGFWNNAAQPGAGGGVSWVTCYDACGNKQKFKYRKICVSGTTGASVTMGVVAGMDGAKCNSQRYSGYFGELGYTYGWFSGGADFGFNDASIPGNNGFPLPGKPSGVSEYAIGIGTSGPKAAVCYYVPF